MDLHGVVFHLPKLICGDYGLWTAICIRKLLVISDGMLCVTTFARESSYFYGSRFTWRVEVNLPTFWY